VRRRSPLFAAAFLAAASLRADGETVYPSAAVSSRWLNAPANARVAALAGAFAARGADPAALEVNPAGMAGMRGWQACLTHNLWVGGLSVDRAVGAMHLGSLGSAALSFDYLNLGDADAYTLDVQGRPVSQGSVHSKAWAAGAGWAIDFGSLNLGVELRGLGEDIAGDGGGSLQADLGGRWVFHSGLRAGLAAKSLGLDGSLRPLNLRGGLGYTLPLGKGALALDLNGDYQPGDAEPPLIRLGAEWATFSRLILRAGYAAGNDRAPAGPACGAGFPFGPIELDYAFYGAGGLGWTHLVSLRILGGEAGL
jgi:hypothetical protein